MVSGNSITNNNANGNAYAVGGVRVVLNQATVMIKSNLIRNNSGHGGQASAGGIKVVNNHAEVVIDSNTISFNQGSAGGGIGIGGPSPAQSDSATILNNLVTENSSHGIYLYSGDGSPNPFASTRIAHNMVKGNLADGINLVHGPFTVTANLVASNLGNGVVLGKPDFALLPRGLITGNAIIANAGIGLLIRSKSEGGAIQQNLVWGNGGAAALDVNHNNWSFAQNNIQANASTYALAYSGANGTTLDAANNWWGTTADPLVQAQIYDWSDDGSKGVVNYLPFLGAPATAAPISPPTDVAITLGLNQTVTVSWSANPEADVAGYKLYVDTDSGYLYASVVDAGDQTSYTFTGLSATTYYFAVTAYDAAADGSNDWTDGHESWFSSEVIADLTPPTMQFSQSSYAVNENVAQATVTATLSKQYGSTVTAAYNTTPGTAASGSDYTPLTGTLTFAPYETSKTLTIAIADDNFDETDETFTLTFLDPTNALLGTPSSVTVTISDNDAPPTAQVSTSTSVVEESAESAEVVVTLSAASALTITADYSTANDIATAPGDYSATSGTVSFAAGEISKTVVIPLINDLLHEEDETFTLALSNAGNATLGTPASATITINDDDAPPSVQLSASTHMVDESAGILTIAVNLNVASDVQATVHYATGAGSAIAGSDYTAISGILTFAPGETSKTLAISIADDSFDESNETLTLTLSSATNAVLPAPASATITINDDDAPPAIRFSSATDAAGERAGTVVMTVTLNTASALTVTADYSTANDTAAAPGDYLATSGTLLFAPGETHQTIALVIADDALDELDETLTVALNNPVNATVTTPATATLTILDDDGPAVALSAASYTANEGNGSAVISVFLDAPSVQVVTVAYTTSDEASLAGHDYTQTAGALTFAPGEQSKTISVPLIDDNTLLEADETFTLTLLDTAGATLGTPTSTTVTIVDNDVNAPPLAVSVPPDPAQPVDVAVETPAGPVLLTLEGVQASGIITVLVSVLAPDQPPGNFSLLGIHYEVSVAGVEFGQATVQFPYRDEDVVAAGVPEESLRLLHFENGQWRDITTALDTNANLITGVTESFSPFVLGVQNMQNCAISLNNGAEFIGRLDVQLFSNTAGAAEMLVSNDAGFTGAQWHAYDTARDWILTDPGNRIVTLLVYTRLRDAVGNLLCSGLSLSDDIIYDPLPPTITSASIQPLQGTMAQEQGSNPIVLEVIAVDQAGGSGVANLQISTDPAFRGAQWQPYSTTVQISSQLAETVYLRVRDGVGNVSAVVNASVSGQQRSHLPLIMR